VTGADGFGYFSQRSVADAARRELVDEGVE
jgi:hypothetical protein